MPFSATKGESILAEEGALVDGTSTLTSSAVFGSELMMFGLPCTGVELAQRAAITDGARRDSAGPRKAREAERSALEADMEAGGALERDASR